jgi:hypothetical protein
MFHSKTFKILFCFAKYLFFFLFFYVLNLGANKEDLLQFYEFGNDPMNMCFKHKTRMKVD